MAAIAPAAPPDVANDSALILSQMKAFECTLTEIFQKAICEKGPESLKMVHTITVTHVLSNGVYCLLDFSEGESRHLSGYRISKFDVESLIHLNPKDLAAKERLERVVDQWLNIDEVFHLNKETFKVAPGDALLMRKEEAKKESLQIAVWKADYLAILTEKVAVDRLESQATSFSNFLFRRVLDVFSAEEMPSVMEIEAGCSYVLAGPLITYSQLHLQRLSEQEGVKATAVKSKFCCIS